MPAPDAPPEPAAGGRRAALADKLADFLLAEGLTAASLRPLAEAAGTSDRMLLYYFRDKADVLAAAIERIAARLVAILEEKRSPAPAAPAALRPRLLDAVLSDALWPYMRLWIEIAAQAGRGDAFYRETGNAIGEGFLAWIEVQLDCPDAETRAVEAAHLLALIEGVLVLKALGLDAAVARLR